MSLYDTLIGKAKKIISSGRQSLVDSFSKEIYYEKEQKADTPWGIYAATDQGPSMKTAQSTASNTIGNKPTPLIKGVVAGGIEAVKLGTSMAQDTARGVATVGITSGNLANKAVGLPAPFESEIPTDQNPITKAVFGGKPVRDIQKYGEEGRKFIKETTGKDVDKRLDIPLGALGVALNVSGGGKGRFIRDIAKSQDEAVIMKNLLKEKPVFNSLDKDISKKLVNLLAKTDDAAEVNKIINHAEGLADTAYKNKAPRVYSDKNIPQAADDEQVVRFVRNKYGDKSEQWVDTNLNRPHEYDGIVEHGTLKKDKVRSTGNIDKDANGYRLIDGESADNVVSKNIDSVKKDAPTNVRKYMKDNITKREAARGDTGFNQRLKDAANEAGSKLVDFTMPIGRAQEKGRKSDKAFADTLKNTPSKDVQYQIDRTLRAPNLATNFIETNGLKKVIQKVDNLDDFDEYLVAKHSIDVDTRGIQTGRDLKSDEAIVRELGPKYEEQAKVVTEYSKRLLDYITESGLISTTVRDTLRARYPNYVPLKRVFSELEESGNTFGSKGVASLGRQSVVQNLVGSERAIESPIRSIIERTNQAFHQAEKNKAAQIITDYKDIKGNPFSLRKVNSTADVSPEMSHISVMRDGKKEIWETSKDIADAAKALNIEQLGIVLKTLSVPMRIARAGITGMHPAFVLANVVRDQVGSFIFADKALKSSIANPENFMKSFWAAVSHNELYDEWVAASGGGTSLDMGRQQLESTVDRIRSGRSVGAKMNYVVRHPIKSTADLFRAVENIIGRSEEFTRIQQYRGHREAALKDGLSKKEADVTGAMASHRNSTNFARRGEWGPALNASVLYLGAGIQGSRLLISKLRSNPVRTSSRIAATILFPTAAITYWNLSDENRKKAYDSIQPYEKENNLILVLDPKYDEKTKRWDGIIKMPLPPGVGQLSNGVRRPIEQSQGGDPVKFNEIASMLGKTFSPTDPTNPLSSLTPQALKPSLQAFNNKDLFTGNSIVSMKEGKLPADKQIRENTSGTAIKIANTLGVSPIKTEKFIGDTAGGVAKNVLNALDRTFTPDQVGGISVLDSISRRFNSAAGGFTEQQAENKAYAALDKQQAEGAARKAEAEKLYGDITSKTKPEGKQQLLDLAKADPEMAKKVLEVAEEKAKGMTKEDSAIYRMGVADKGRATYIKEQLNAIKEKDGNAAAKAYLLDLVEKKVVTKEVLKQITELP